MKYTYIEKEEAKLSLFAYDMFTQIENLKASKKPYRTNTQLQDMTQIYKYPTNNKKNTRKLLFKKSSY